MPEFRSMESSAEHEAAERFAAEHSASDLFPDQAPQPEAEGEEPKTLFEQLPPEYQERYKSLIANKLAEQSEHVPAIQVEMISGILQEIVSRWHENLLDGGDTEEDRTYNAYNLLDGLVEKIEIRDKDEKSAKDTLLMAGANGNRIFLFPQFFVEQPRGKEFDREHILAHELGEIFRQQLSKDDLETYQSYKLNHGRDFDGDYVNMWEGDDRRREEFAETFAEFSCARNELEMYSLRFDRFRKPEDRAALESLKDTEEGQKQLLSLLRETYLMRGFLQHRAYDLAPKMAELAKAHSEEEEENRDALLEQLLAGDQFFDGSRSQQMPLPRKSKPNLIVHILEKFFGPKSDTKKG